MAALAGAAAPGAAELCPWGAGACCGGCGRGCAGLGAGPAEEPLWPVRGGLVCGLAAAGAEEHRVLRRPRELQKWRSRQRVLSFEKPRCPCAELGTQTRAFLVKRALSA